MKGQLLADRYELLEKVGGGGMGQVWRGRDKVLERIVAIKTVDLAMQDATMRERFRREAIATAGLNAPNVVQVYDAGFDGTLAYLVMELLTGPTIAQVVHDQGQMSPEDAIQVAVEVAKGLLAAHRIGVVHRDIKPGNVMYHEREIKLVDFGIAQLAQNMGATLTAPATALGTAAYMSPEQATGEGASDKSDWYALGCLIMTMVTGKAPFTGEPLAVATQHLNSRPPHLTERRHDVPMGLDQLVNRMLAKNPADRPEGQQVLEQLRLLSVDPNAGTILTPLVAPTQALGPRTQDQTGIYAPTSLSSRSVSDAVVYSDTPVEPIPAVEPAPIAGTPATREAAPKRRWPVILVLVMLILVGFGAAYALTRPDATPPAPATTPSASPTPTASPTAAATTRATSNPTRTRTIAPTPRRTTIPTTSAPTTPTPTPSPEPTATVTTPETTPPTTSAPADETSAPANGGNGNGNSGNGNSGNGNSGNGNGGNGNGAGNSNENSGPSAGSSTQGAGGGGSGNGSGGSGSGGSDSGNGNGSGGGNDSGGDGD